MMDQVLRAVSSSTQCDKLKTAPHEMIWSFHAPYNETESIRNSKEILSLRRS